MLPPFTAGAHIEIALPGNIARHYSLLNNPNERHRYLIAVRRQSQGRGGSRYMHDELRVGDRLAVSAPRNHFPLNEAASRSVLFAGGIGITPLYSMISRLEALGGDWVLHYAARSQRHAPLLDLLEPLKRAHPERIHLYFEAEPGKPAFDIRNIVSAAGAEDHFYCCGPTPMLDAYQQACKDIAPARVHMEYFGPRQAVPLASESDAGPKTFAIDLRRSGMSLSVPPDKSILDVVLEAGIDASFSCGEGFCGYCRTAVLDGEPEHRDTVLDETERAAGNVMMICCSRSCTDRLVLDL